MLTGTHYMFRYYIDYYGNLFAYISAIYPIKVSGHYKFQEHKLENILDNFTQL